MCYDVAYNTRKLARYESRYNYAENIDQLKILLPPTYHLQAFSKGQLPVVTNEDPNRVQAFRWGLIPGWVKDVAQSEQVSSRTLNCIGEEMFEKNSFRHSAKSKRCIIIVDGFYEHHWSNNKSYPYFVFRKDEQPFSLAGLWTTWSKDDVIRNTVTIVTGPANRLLSHIHNRPAANTSPRMPVILTEDTEEQWLFNRITNDGDKEELLKLVKAYPDDELLAHPVGRIRGKNALGNVPHVMDKFIYNELNY